VRGTVDVSVFVASLGLGLPAAFAAGYYWCSTARFAKVRRRMQAFESRVADRARERSGATR
jgi:hypothetical protein